MKKLALLAAFLLLPVVGACDTISSYIPSLPQDVATLEIGLTAADQLALAYISQPVCGSPKAGPVCSQIAIVRKIKTASDAAYAAVKAAEKTENQNTLAAAQTALDAYKQITDLVTPSK